MICRIILSCPRAEDFFGSAQLALPRALLSHIPKLGSGTCASCLETGTCSELGFCSVGEQSLGVEWLMMARGSEVHSLISS